MSDFLQARGKAGIADVDTRAITRRLRDTGALNGVITSDASVRHAARLRCCAASPCLWGCCGPPCALAAHVASAPLPALLLLQPQGRGGLPAQEAPHAEPHVRTACTA